MRADVNLTGQVAVVTGGGRGIGREIAQALARAGARVAVTARSRDQLDETVSLLEDQGLEGAAFEMDVSSPEQVKAGMSAITERFGDIDLLVNNAGVGNVDGKGVTPLWEMDISDWRYVMEVNVLGVVSCSQAVLPAMMARQRGRIINIGSNAGIRPLPLAAAYSVSKAALLRLTDSLAQEVQDYGVRVFAISPGLVLTDMTRDVPVFKDLPESAWTPVERAGELCVFLASGQADQLSGRYFHASSDNMEELVKRADEIVNEDLYTLRLRVDED